MSKIKWLSVDDPKEIYQNNQTSIVFKHSPRCIISRIVLKKFEYDYAPSSKIDNFYLLNVISERQISNELSHLYNLNHESPQVLLIKSNKLLFDASHSDIKFKDLININC